MASAAGTIFFRHTFRSRLFLLTLVKNKIIHQSKYNLSSSLKYSKLFKPHIPIDWTKIRELGTMAALSPMDPSSYSRPDLALMKHASLNLTVDFCKKVLRGEAKLIIVPYQPINDIILDVRDLTINCIKLEDGTALKYVVDETVPDFGSKLTVTLPKGMDLGGESIESLLEPGLKEAAPSTALVLSGYIYKIPVSETCCSPMKRLVLVIQYQTAPNASALQWLAPEQTAGKRYPYLFSQCQPIHARSILPCQDTPAVKFTYDAKVSAPEEFTVLMSALRGETKGNVTSFNQPVPVPSYLVAIAVGVLEHRKLGPRSLVWAEKEEIERSAWEFAETEKYLQAAERLCGPYVWTQYDLLVLPPSFPYGGMENPCLTFVTPTLLAGDRSQADVIVHEIMHSWTGNLVTNRNFEHFWLNEGFTVFLERKVAASLVDDYQKSKKSRDFHSLLGLQDLNETVTVTLGEKNPYTQLIVDLSGVHPDEAFSSVPYEKGSLFLRYLENLFGGPEIFDEFLRSYLKNFQRQSLDTVQFRQYLENYFKGNCGIKEIDWSEWLYSPGMPPIIPTFDTSMTKAVNALVQQLNNPETTQETIRDSAAAFTPHQTIHLLQKLIDSEALSLDKLHDVGAALKLNDTHNSEILYRWLRLCVRSKDESKIQNALDFVNSQGRMKYVRPIYRDLYAWEQVRKRTIDNFLANEQYMMHVSAYNLRKDLHLKEKIVAQA